MADTVALMKQRVLDMAIRGELVEQRSEEGTAEELLSRIFDNTNNMQDYREKYCDDIETHQIPFLIPDSWEWVKHNHLFEIVGGSQPPKSNFIHEEKEGYIRLYQIRDYGQNPQPVYVPIDKVTKFTKKNDILLARYGASVGKVFLAEEGAYNVAMARVTPLFERNKFSYAPYMYYYYHTYLYQDLVLGINRSAQAGFNKGDLDALYIPLPPADEQKRIVAKIEEIFAVIDQISIRKEEALTIIQSMRQAALQSAIMGLLVEQDESDESASLLYEKIQAEKEQLVKEKKIKKENSLSAIEEEEIPFEIPKTWKWVRLGEIISLVSGRDLATKDFNEIEKGLPYITGASNFNLGKLIVNRWTENPKVISKRGDLLITVKGTIGDMHFQEIEEAHIARQVMAVRNISDMNLEYIKYFLDAELSKLKDKAKSMIPGVSRDDILNFELPLPPLAEQDRIVEKLDEIMAICDQMEAIFDGSSGVRESLNVV